LLSPDGFTPEHVLEKLTDSIPALSLREISRMKATLRRKLARLQRKFPEAEEVSYSGPIDPSNPLDRIRSYRQVIDACNLEIASRGRNGVASSSEPGREFEHSPDYRTIVFRGKRYVLTSQQARAVEILHEAFQSGKPDVSDHTLLESLETTNTRLRDTFKKSPLWNIVIISGERKGMHRLNLS